jgi:hypothetical protein
VSQCLRGRRSHTILMSALLLLLLSLPNVSATSTCEEITQSRKGLTFRSLCTLVPYPPPPPLP